MPVVRCLAVHNCFVESGVEQTTLVKSAANGAEKGVHLPMKTAAEYRAMAEECFKWAHKAHSGEVRMSYLHLAQVWLDAASVLDGLPPDSATDSRSSIEQRRGFGRAEGGF